jgi:hypothetical protein
MVAGFLGWDTARVQRIACDHQILFRVQTKKAREPLQLHEVSFVGQRARFRGRCVLLPEAEGRIFSYILHTPGEKRTLKSIRDNVQITKRGLVAGIVKLRGLLNRIGLTISTWRYDLELA